MVERKSLTTPPDYPNPSALSVAPSSREVPNPVAPDPSGSGNTDRGRVRIGLTGRVRFVRAGVNTYRDDALDVTVRVLGRTGIAYERLGRTVRVDSEVLVNGMGVWTRGLEHWDDGAPITSDQRAEIADDIATAIIECCPGETVVIDGVLVHNAGAEDDT